MFDGPKELKENILILRFLIDFLSARSGPMMANAV